MLDLKKLLGDKYNDNLTDAEKLALLNELNLADLSSGEYVAKGKFDAREGEIAKLQKVVADYQEKERANLTDAQRKDLEYQTLQKSNSELTKEIERFKLKETIINSGYSADECNKIMEAQEKGENVSAVYAEIMKARIDDATLSAKAESIKKGIPTPPQGGDNIDTDIDSDDEAVAFAKSLAQENSPDTKSLDAIKGAYSSVSEIK